MIFFSYVKNYIYIPEVTKRVFNSQLLCSGIEIKIILCNATVNHNLGAVLMK